MQLFSIVPALLTVFLAVQTAPVAQTHGPDYIEDVKILGNKTPTATIKNQLRTKKGDTFDQATVDQDVVRLYKFNGGLFDDIEVTSEPDPHGGIVLVFTVKEKRRIVKIEYEGLKTYTKSDVSDKLHEKKISLSQDSKYDPTIVSRAVALLKVMLAEKGHQDATVEATTEAVTESSVALTFRVNEGPKIRIEKITLSGNKTFSDRTIKSQMKLVKAHGPLTAFTGKDTYHSLKLGDDLTRIQMFYNDHGFARINITDPTVDTKPVTIHRTIPFWKPLFPWGIPVPFVERTVSRLFVGIQIEENDQYHINDVKILGVKTPQEEAVVNEFLGFKKGDIYNAGQLRRGIENLKKFYGAGGYINFSPEPNIKFNEDDKTVDLIFNVVTGKQFSIRRINFYGNTTTRDKVIRRELDSQEGAIFNANYLRNDILRMNQLAFFDEIKEDDAHVDQNDKDANPTVDINIKVAEKGKNTIGLSGGASAIGGSFIGANYSTNNLMGHGENVSLDVQAGTRQSNFVFSVNEPYFRDRPVSLGFSVSATTFHYDQARYTFGLDPNNLPQGLGLENRLNYDQRQNGFSVYTSYPLRVFSRFARLNLSYQFSNSQTSAVNPATEAYFQAVVAQQSGSFVSPVGSGFSEFRTRRISPSFSFSTVDNPNFPTNGKAITLAFDYTGGPLGGNVNIIRPSLELRYYKPITRRREVIAMRLAASHVRGFSGITIPFYERFQIGGEYDIRGFENRALSPISFVTQLLDAVDPETGGTSKRPYDDAAYVGGDTQAVFNAEFRIKVIGPITVSPFFDIGNTWAISQKELTRKFVDSSGVLTTENAHYLSGTNSGLRASTGLEVGVVLPMFNVPFRLIFGYNPLRLDRQEIGPMTGMPFQLVQPKKAIKFSIGRTF